MILKGVIAAFVAAIIILFAVIIAWNVLVTINGMNDAVAKSLGTTPQHHFQNAADSVFVNIAWIAAFVIAGILLVYLIHIRRR